VAKLFDDLRSACRNIAEHAGHLRATDEVLNHWLRKTVRVSRKRALENDTGHLPMSCRRIFAVRFQRALAVGPARIGNRRNSGEWTNVSQPEALQIRQIQLPRFTDVAKRI